MDEHAHFARPLCWRTRLTSRTNGGNTPTSRWRDCRERARISLEYYARHEPNLQHTSATGAPRVRWPVPVPVIQLLPIWPRYIRGPRESIRARVCVCEFFFIYSLFTTDSKKNKKKTHEKKTNPADPRPARENPFLFHPSGRRETFFFFFFLHAVTP